MKKLFFMLAISGLTVMFSAFVSVNEADVTTVNKAFFRAMGDEDGKSIEALMDTDYNLVFPDGNGYDGSTVVMGISGGYATFDISDVESATIKMLGADGAIATGTWKVKGQVQGATVEYRAVYTNVFVKKGGAWKLTHTQLTAIK